MPPFGILYHTLDYAPIDVNQYLSQYPTARARDPFSFLALTYSNSMFDLAFFEQKIGGFKPFSAKTKCLCQTELLYWLQSNGVNIIPNIRLSDERTYPFAFEGIEQGGTVAVSTNGCIQKKLDRYYFTKGLVK